MDKSLVEKTVYSLAELCRITSLSRSCLYQEIRMGRLKAVKQGRRTLVLHSDFHRWLNTLPTVGGDSSDKK